jgi:hypothetical protein
LGVSAPIPSSFFNPIPSIQFLQGNSPASDASRDRNFATHNEIRILTHQIGVFPQSLGNIPHRKSQSAGLTMLIYVGLHVASYPHINSARRKTMQTLKTVNGSDRGEAVVDEGNAIVVSEWDADAFHRRMSDLELRGYVVRRETYRVTPEMDPETGRIVHLHTVELCRPGSD